VHLFILAISCAALCNDMTLASTWAMCQDIGGRYTAVTAASMNTIGSLGAAAAGWATGTIIDRSLSAHASTLQVAVEQLPASEKHAAIMTGFDYNFMSFAAVYAVAALCWRFIDSEIPIVAVPQFAKKS